MVRGWPERVDEVRATLGMRRVSWVRVVLGADGEPVRAEVAGTGHRLPVLRPVPLATATSLAAAGVPTVVRKRPSPRARHGRLPLPSGH